GGGGGEEPEVGRSHPNRLKRSLPLRGTDRRDDDSAARGSLAKHRHEDFTTDNDGDDPPVECHDAKRSQKLKPPSVSTLSGSRNEWIVRRRHKHEHGNQRREEQKLIGERIEQTAQIGDQVA